MQKVLDNVNGQQINHLPNEPGVGFKAEHFSALLNTPSAVGWVEIHAENYMGDGGRPLAQLRKLSAHYPISVHGVGLSIGAEKPIDIDHLNRLKHLVDWLQPASFSEHLAWSTHNSSYLNDLLPLPYTEETLNRISSHIMQVQETLGCPMLLENPSSYLAFAESSIEEVEFLKLIVERTGCGLLLDVNNVFVSATNQNTDAYAYIDSFPLQHVGEIHLAGHDQNVDEKGGFLLLDSHACEVADPVWELYRYTIKLAGAKPTLIEWDSNIPDWPVLAAEASKILPILNTAHT